MTDLYYWWPLILAILALMTSLLFLWKKSPSRPEYVNLPTVCVALVEVEHKLLVIRRANPSEVGFNQLALPGGFQEGKDKENMHATVKRELYEETGLDISNPQKFSEPQLFDARTDEFGHNVLFFSVYFSGTDEDLWRYIVLNPEEVSEAILIDEPVETCFPIHTEVIKRWFLC